MAAYKNHSFKEARQRRLYDYEVVETNLPACNLR
jgi:hypothetical protein